MLEHMFLLPSDAVSASNVVIPLSMPRKTEMCKNPRGNFSYNALMFLLQWNARSLIANGQEFKGYIEKLKRKMEETRYLMHSRNMP